MEKFTAVLKRLRSGFNKAPEELRKRLQHIEQTIASDYISNHTEILEKNHSSCPLSRPNPLRNRIQHVERTIAARKKSRWLRRKIERVGRLSTAWGAQSYKVSETPRDVNQSQDEDQVNIKAQQVENNLKRKDAPRNPEEVPASKRLRCNDDSVSLKAIISNIIVHLSNSKLNSNSDVFNRKTIWKAIYFESKILPNENLSGKPNSTYLIFEFQNWIVIFLDF